jgi:hypothetical protein
MDRVAHATADVRRLAPRDGHYWVRGRGVLGWHVLRLVTREERLWADSSDGVNSLLTNTDEDMIGCEIVGPIAEPD